MNKTSIAWTDRTWNPVSGCTPISAGCDHCYARTFAERLWGTPAFPNGFDLTFRPHKLKEPFRLKEPTMIFVNSMSDFFHQDVPDEYRDQIVDVMGQTPQHIYQVLTKRACGLLYYSRRRKLPANFWAGVTIENQTYEKARAACLRDADVSTRFISVEPLLGPLSLDLDRIDWVIVGGESGRHLYDDRVCKERGLAEDRGPAIWRPREDRIDWVRSIRDQCITANVPFFFKQWGGATPKSAGRELDWRTWEEYPRERG